MRRAFELSRTAKTSKSSKSKPTKSQKEAVEEHPNDSNKGLNDNPAEPNAANPLTERGVLRGKHQSMTAEQRSTREASSPPDQNKIPLKAEHTNPEQEPAQEDAERILNNDTP